MSRRFDADAGPLVIERQGSFAVGGSVTSAPGVFDPLAFMAPAGQTIHGDHAYVQFQIPPNARPLPLVLWHGAGQMGKTWESTPDGRDGFQTILVRRGFAVYILDQPRRGRGGRAVEDGAIPAFSVEQSQFTIFRLGVWPNRFPNSQFPQGEEALDQFFRQSAVDTGPAMFDDPKGQQIHVGAVSALFDRIGPAVLITHSGSGVLGWLTAIASPNVRAVVSYEPVQFAFPGMEPVPPVSPSGAPVFGSVALTDEEFACLARIPIQIVYGDNIPASASPYAGLDYWRVSMARAEDFAQALNAVGGDASLLHLPKVGQHGNTHFPFADLNNLAVADLLSAFLAEKGLD
jgi:hypothetical protein